MNAILKQNVEVMMAFTVRCYAERRIAIVSRPSVCNVDFDYIGWNSSKTISWLISLGSPADPNNMDLLQGGHPN